MVYILVSNHKTTYPVVQKVAIYGAHFVARIGDVIEESLYMEKIHP
jgi:hypothetical protein